jgi:hypothetical protein
MKNYSLDRTAFKAHTAKDAGNHSVYYKNKSWKERLEIAAYLNSVAFDYPINDPPKMDKMLFHTRERDG